MLRLTGYGKNYDIQKWADALTSFTPFVSGSLRGVTEPEGTGILPGDLRYLFEGRKSKIRFVVYSYETPIAWYDEDAEWIVPNERYSQTTSQQQGRIRHALNVAGVQLGRQAVSA